MGGNIAIFPNRRAAKKIRRAHDGGRAHSLACWAKEEGNSELLRPHGRGRHNNGHLFQVAASQGGYMAPTEGG
jgi:hypothetical protein